MKINTVLDYLNRYVPSILYPLTIAVFTFLVWLLPSYGSLVFSILISVLAFLPLIVKCGKAYTALLLFPIISQSQDISMLSISPHILMMAVSISVSLIAYLIIYKPTFVRGSLFVPLVLLILSFFVSYFHASIVHQSFNKAGILYLFFMSIQLLLYTILCTVIGKENSFPYLCQVIVLFSLTISLEIFTYFFIHGFSISPKDFTLGWSYTIQSASSLLCMTLPFYGVLIYSKKWYWMFGEMFILASIFLLSTDSALLSLLFAFIPLILLAFRSYGKHYSYISLAMIFTIGTILVIMLLNNRSFARRLLDALTSLNLFHEPEGPRKDLFDAAIADFLSSPYVGTSISSFDTGKGTLTFSGNTILSIGVMSGTLGFVFYLFFEIRLYFCTMKKKTPDKWTYLVFLLMLEMIGLIDNTLFNIGIFQLLLISFAAYEMSNRPEDVQIHDDFYNNYRKKPDSLT